MPQLPEAREPHSRGDELMDRGAVQCLESLPLASEAKVEMCIPQPVSVAVAAMGAMPVWRLEGEGDRSGGLDPNGHRCKRCFVSRNVS